MDAQGSVTNAKEDTVYLHRLVTEKRFPDLVFRHNGGSAVNLLTPATNLTANDFDILHTGAPVGNMYFKVGFSEIPEALEVEIAVGSTITNTISWRHKSTDTFFAYTAFSGVTDGTAHFTNTGTCVVTWTPPSPGSWVLYTTSGLYELIGLVSSYTSAGTIPRGSWVYGHFTVAEDASQYATNLTKSGGGHYELTSVRTAITGETGREVYVRCELTAAEADATLISHNSTDDSKQTFAIRTDASGYLDLYQEGASKWKSTATVPAADLSIAWSSRANPDTTGASDAVISEIIIYDHTAGDYVEIDQFTHAKAMSAADRTLTVGGAWTGSLTRAPTNAPTKARVSASFHNSVEFAEDWIAARTAYAGTLEDVPDEPIPITWASGIANSGYFVGRSQVGYTAAHAKAIRRRGWSNLVNDLYVDPDTLEDTPAPDHWNQASPGAGGYALMLQWLRWVEVPAGATHAYCRAQSKSWVTSGSSVPFGLRVYAFNRPPTLTKIGQTPTPPLEYRYREVILDEDHTSTGIGEWVELGLVKLPRFTAALPGWTDTVFLCLAYKVDPAAASANDAAARIQINAWHARPVEIWTPGGLG